MQIRRVVSGKYPACAHNKRATPRRKRPTGEEKKAFKVDATGITIVVFHDIAVPNIYLGTKPLAKVLETLPKA